MKHLLSGCMTSLATKCYSKELINQDLYSSIFDRNYGSTQQRVDSFLLEIIRRVESHEKNGEPQQALGVIQQFADIVGWDTALAHLANEIRMTSLYI